MLRKTCEVEFWITKITFVKWSTLVIFDVLTVILSTFKSVDALWFFLKNRWLLYWVKFNTLYFLVFKFYNQYYITYQITLWIRATIPHTSFIGEVKESTFIDLYMLEKEEKSTEAELDVHASATNLNSQNFSTAFGEMLTFLWGRVGVDQWMYDADYFIDSRD